MRRTATRVAVCFCALLIAGCASLRAPSPERFSDYAESLKAYARYSQVLYRERATLPGAEVHAIGYRGLLGAGRSRYLLVTDDRSRHQTVIVQGTGTLQDLGIGFDVLPVHDPALGLDLHAGFRELALAVRRDLLPRLKDGYTIGVGGHSAGGAAAQILALYLQEVDHLSVDAVYTFGQPQFAVPAAKSGELEDRTLRVINCDDAIPLLPNPPGTTALAGGYRQSGRTVYLADDGRVWFSRNDVEPDTLKLIGRNVLREFLAGTPFRAHLIDSYVERLAQARQDPVAADYRPDDASVCS